MRVVELEEPYRRVVRAPTIEYPTQAAARPEIDLDAHFGDNGNPPPIILDYWHSGHYDGTRTNISAGEEWHKVIGPIFVYVNKLDSPRPTTRAELNTLAATASNPTVPQSWTENANALWDDANAQWKKRIRSGPTTGSRAWIIRLWRKRRTVKGQIVLNDPLAPGSLEKRTVVGLTHSDIDPAAIPRPVRPAGFGGFGAGQCRAEWPRQRAGCRISGSGDQA